MEGVTVTNRVEQLRRQLAQRILVLDGGMGTMIQSYRLEEGDFRGERFADWPSDLKGNNDLLVLSQPDVIKAIQNAYLEAGADILETNTFNATSIAMADYHMESLSAEINYQAACLARACADEWTARTPDKPRFVAGVLGPTNRTASISPDVNDPGVPQRHLRRAGGGLPRIDARAGGGRRRPDPDRNHLRHPQRQGRRFSRWKTSSRRWAWSCRS